MSRKRIDLSQSKVIQKNVLYFLNLAKHMFRLKLDFCRLRSIQLFQNFRLPSVLRFHFSCTMGSTIVQ